MNRTITSSKKINGTSKSSNESLRKLNEMIEELSKNEKENAEEQKKQTRRSELKNNFNLIFNAIRLGLEVFKDIGDG
jgi:hypothetical protein